LRKGRALVKEPPGARQRKSSVAARTSPTLRRVLHRLVRFAAGVVAVVLLLAAACRIGMGLLPERYAVNAPITQMLLGRGVEAQPEDELRARLVVPEGFSVSLYASGLANARMLRFTERGDLLVSTPRSGHVWLLARDDDHDGRADAVTSLLDGLDRPHGLDFHDGWLYVAEGSAIRRVRYDADARRVAGALEPVATGLPNGGNHWTRQVRFGPDGRMYVTVGSSCNVCREEDPRRAAMLRFAADGGEPETFATGLRNSVGFDWQPGTNALYATDNGRDLLGDDIPPCELNHIVQGGFYGWPIAYGDRVPDPDLGAGHEAEIARSLPPAHAFRAHNAPLGMTFVRGPNAPDALRGLALVALHGSWNRTHKDGYKVVSLRWTPDGAIEERDFLAGFVRDEQAIGRPVDVAEGPDGAIYVSDDYAGAVYRVATGAAAAIATSAAPAAPQPVGDPLAALDAAERAREVASGRALYEANACFRCHEPARAEAGAVPAPLAKLASKYTIDSLASFLAAPQPPMPLYPFDDAQRRALAIFLLAEKGR
jgi:glucose/arabinose dehydrogenase